MSNRCSTCPHTHRCVGPDGPIDASVFCIGEAPGYDEDQGGRPFIGRAGREFNEHYLHLAGLHRDEIYITNTVQCRPDQNRKPRYAEVWGCAPNHIPKELNRVGPKVVVLMGATACSLLERWGGKPDLDAEHGIPRQGRLFDWEGWIVPMYHPAAGLHDSSMMTPLMEDWEKLGVWLETGEWQWARDQIGKRDYRLLDSKQDVERYFCRHTWWSSSALQYRGCEPKRWAGADTESHAVEPLSIQVSLATGTGGLVLWKNAEVVRYLAECMRHCDEILYHYAPADQPMFDQMGLGYIPYRDTMQEAYGLLLPQALKTLSRRLLGRVRKSWDETVTPPSKKVLAQWLRDCMRYSETWTVVEERTHKKTGKPLKPKVIVSPTEKLIVELYGYMVNNPEYKIWEKIKERMLGGTLAQLEQKVGRMPVKGVAHLTTQELVDYGCSDADDTLTLGLMFEKMRKDFVANLDVQPEDRDT